MAFLSSSFLLLKTCPQPLHANPTAKANTGPTEKPMHKTLKSSSASAPDKPAGKTAAPLNHSAESSVSSVDLETSNIAPAPQDPQAAGVRLLSPVRSGLRQGHIWLAGRVARPSAKGRGLQGYRFVLIERRLKVV